jgi:hypothetical protein
MSSILETVSTNQDQRNGGLGQQAHRRAIQFAKDVAIGLDVMRR